MEHKDVIKAKVVEGQKKNQTRQRRKSVGGVFGPPRLALVPLEAPASLTTAAPTPPATNATDRYYGEARSYSNAAYTVNSKKNGRRLLKSSRPRGSGSIFRFAATTSKNTNSATAKPDSKRVGKNINSSTPDDSIVTQSAFSQRSYSPNVDSSDHCRNRPNPSSLSRDAAHWRSKSFPRSMRKSVFGSLRSLGSIDDDKHSTRARSKASSGDEDDVPLALKLTNYKACWGDTVLHHGEVQTTGGMWRRKSQYLVLTETHLVRFRNQTKASERFPVIDPSTDRGGSNGVITSVSKRHSFSSFSAIQDYQLSSTIDVTASAIPLSAIVAVHKLDDGRPAFSIEVCYLDERTSKPTALHLQLNDPRDSESWLAEIRTATDACRVLEQVAYDDISVQYVTKALESERDYDPKQFRMFRVVQRASTKPVGRLSNDDLSKVASTVCYLAIGVNKIHLLPLRRASSRTSIVSLAEMELGMAYGIMTLTSLSMHKGDDAFQLIFRSPFRTPVVLHLSSTYSAEISLLIRQRAEFLRPEWIYQPFAFYVPSWVEKEFVPSVYVSEDHRCFDRTLIGYCAAFDVDTSNIRYMIDYNCDNAPCFQLLPPSRECGTYMALELLAVMRALRYNESFGAISFSGVSLDALQDLRDPFGIDIDAFRTRANVPVNIPGHEKLSILSLEIRAIALKSKRLRRMDFSFCLSRIPLSEKRVRDPGCGIPEALFPLCRRLLTNVDWIALNGIKLGDSDLDYLIDAASQKFSHLRALEVGHCGISIHDLDLILSTITAQESTLQAINVSGVQGRLSPELFQQQIGYFGHIRKIDLSHISRTSGGEPLIPPETLMTWRLEELSLSHTSMNGMTVDSIAAYLSYPKSHNMKVLRLDQCGLTGKDVAVFLHSMTPDDDGVQHRPPRNLHLYVSENRLDIDYSLLIDSIAQNKTPTHLTMRMVEFQKEAHFRRLVEAVTKNSTLKYLDISKASLPYDAGQETCMALQSLFEENSTIEELDISGEYAHLDVAQFGIGLNLALTGLKRNKSLRVLRIEYQRLGLQGANTLASVLEENIALRKVYCDNNEINLQSFTTLVRGLEHNKTLLYLSPMDHDRHEALERLRREIEPTSDDVSGIAQSTVRSIRRSIHAAVNVAHVSVGGGNKLTKPQSSQSSPLFMLSITPVPPKSANSNSSTTMSCIVRSEIQAALGSLDEKWQSEVQQLHGYLLRNHNLANGIVEDTGETLENDQVAQYAEDGRDPISGLAKLTDPPLSNHINGRPPLEADIAPNMRLSSSLSGNVSDRDSRDHDRGEEPNGIELVQDKDDQVDDSEAKVHRHSFLALSPQFKKQDFSLQMSSNAIPDDLSNAPSDSAPPNPHAKPAFQSCRRPRPMSYVGSGSFHRGKNSEISRRGSVSTSSSSRTNSNKNNNGSRADLGLANRLNETAMSLRSLLTARALERKRRTIDARTIPFDQPPRLDWTLPDLEA